MKYKFIKLSTIDSTQFEARRIIANSSKKSLDSSAIVICASTMTQGIGTKGRSWISPAGNNNVLLSILSECNIHDIQNNISSLPLVIAIAVSSTIEELVNNQDIHIAVKWPNDVLINGKKVAGILVEKVVSQNRCFLITGIGVNVDSSPTVLTDKATSIMEEVKKMGYNINIDYNNIVNILINYVDYYQKIWQAEGFESLKQIWLNKAFCLNTSITVKHNKKYESGIFQGIDIHGQLLLKLRNNNINAYSSLDEILLQDRFKQNCL